MGNKGLSDTGPVHSPISRHDAGGKNKANKAKTANQNKTKLGVLKLFSGWNLETKTTQNSEATRVGSRHGGKLSACTCHAPNFNNPRGALGIADRKSVV